MGVRVAQRYKSPVQYVDNARKIADEIAERMQRFLDKIQKKYNRFKYIANKVHGYYYECTTKYAIEAYICVSHANRIYIKDENSFKRRQTQLKDAIEYYNKLASVVSILFEKFGNYFNVNAISNLTDFINKEIEEIQKIIANDKLVVKSRTEPGEIS